MEVAKQYGQKDVEKTAELIANAQKHTQKLIQLMEKFQTYWQRVAKKQLSSFIIIDNDIVARIYFLATKF